MTRTAQTATSTKTARRLASAALAAATVALLGPSAMPALASEAGVVTVGSRTVATTTTTETARTSPSALPGTATRSSRTYRYANGTWS